MTPLQTSAFASQASAAPRVARARLRSVAAVASGLVAIFAVTTAVDVLLHALHVFPAWTERMSDALFVLALAYRIPFNVAGSYVTARLAPSRPMTHALALGAVGTFLASLGAIAMWAYGPAWYSIANILMAFPCAWAGAAAAWRLNLVERGLGSDSGRPGFACREAV
jgi:hypothetical protein